MLLPESAIPYLQINVYFVCDIKVKSCSFDKQGHFI